MKIFLISIILLVSFLMQGQDNVPEGSAGFYTPPRKGQLWDTWMYYYDGTFYMYYLGGKFVKWDTHELATSTDGVNWEALPPLREICMVNSGELKSVYHYFS